MSDLFVTMKLPHLETSETHLSLFQIRKIENLYASVLFP